MTCGIGGWSTSGLGAFASNLPKALSSPYSTAADEPIHSGSTANQAKLPGSGVV